MSMDKNGGDAKERPPAVVLALAAAVPQLGPRPPRPIAWKEYGGEWVIVFEDGRKLRFVQAAPPMKMPVTAKKEKAK